MRDEIKKIKNKKTEESFKYWSVFFYQFVWEGGNFTNDVRCISLYLCALLSVDTCYHIPSIRFRGADCGQYHIVYNSRIGIIQISTRPLQKRTVTFDLIL